MNTLEHNLRTVASVRLHYGIEPGTVEFAGERWIYVGPAHVSVGGRWLRWDRRNVVLYRNGQAIVADAREVYL